MSERMLSAIQAVEKGARPVFPIMPFSAFPEFMDQLKKALERRAHRFTGRGRLRKRKIKHAKPVAAAVAA